ncbi:ATP-binding cassette domain-containing protein [Actinomyces respiraculi]|uniref:ATP-binding cassette domain-containing protein n=1 Tax=Actinomyces respiraculi TaxID=2744574 RepID=UPI001420C64F|nr:ATP-binding cassette domain-containing protein [Actinomyces respiraculi]
MSVTIILKDLVVDIAGRRLVDGVSLELAPGTSTALVGASGAGKSLTCAAVAGTLAPDARADGILAREDAPDRNLLALPAQRRPADARIALVQQDPATALHPLVPVIDQVALAAAGTSRGLGRRSATARALELIVAVGLDADLAERVPGRLSGGQRQRAALAVALASDPAVLLTDEPTTALDVLARAEVLTVLTEVLASLGDSAPALLLVTHDLPAAAGCDRVVVMHEGRVIEHGDALTVLTAPEHPVTRAMCAAAREETLAGARAAIEARRTFTARADADCAVHAFGDAPAPVREGVR